MRAIKRIGIAAAILAGLAMAVTGPYLSQERAEERFRETRERLPGPVVLYTDQETGCQYLYHGSRGGMTPRRDESGEIICGSATSAVDTQRERR